MVKNIFILLAAIVLVGCDPYTNRVQVAEYSTASTTNKPSRFRVESSDYYPLSSVTPNFTVTVLSDTKGTNDIIVVSGDRGGIEVMYIAKPEVQAEDWRK